MARPTVRTSRSPGVDAFVPDDAFEERPAVPKVRAAQESRPTPNVFIVGAPKSGTTALANYLSSHPDVFVAGKELSYFGSDLVFRTDAGGRWWVGYDTYLRWFAAHGERRYRVDRSVFSLFSSRAAAEIHAFDPASRVIAILRNPVDQMHSQYSEMRFQGEEDISDFVGALAAEEARAAGRRVPPGCKKVFALRYRALARYHDQLARYLEVFGPARVAVVLHDDLAADPAGTYGTVLRFLGVDDGHVPEFAVVNANKEVRSPRLRALLGGASPGLRRLGRLAVRDEHARAALRRRLHRVNTRSAPRPAMSAELRAQLTEEFAPEVRRVAGLIGRDLSAWL
jgi:hypothetical protein